MRSNMLDAVLASRTGARRGRSLDRVWAAMTPFERGYVERQVAAQRAAGVRCTLIGGTEPLFYSGPLADAGTRVLAVIGQRDGSGDAVRLAERAARSAATAGVTVLSGDGEGPERAALAAAVQAGGLAITVLAEGFGPHGATSPSWVRHPVRLVSVTPCGPCQPWSMDTALARNATIAGLCTAMVVINPAGSGAVLDAAMRALAAGRPVLAVGQTPGAHLLVDYGAVPATDEIELAWWLHTRVGTRPRAPRPTPVPASQSHHLSDTA
ncbi:MAG TPA: DNA-processing protein DprA [Pseudonocardiaceae bacterium]